MTQATLQHIGQSAGQDLGYPTTDRPVSREGLRLPYNRKGSQQGRTQATLQQKGQDSGYPAKYMPVRKQD